MSNQRMPGSWGASLPRQPVQAGRGTGPNSDLVKPSGKQPPVVPKVQHDLVAHLQRAFPILESSIVQLIVDESGEGGISDAVKTLSSLAADAETEAASSSSVQGFTHPVSGSPSSCVDDKVAIDMAIAASLADEKVQSSVSNGKLLVETVDSGCWDAEIGWETADPAVAVEWGASASDQSNTVITGSGSDPWQDLPVQSAPSVVEGTDMRPVQVEGALVDSWGKAWRDSAESHEESAKPWTDGEAAARDRGVQAMAAILGENWAKEPLWSSGHGDFATETRDPTLGWPAVQDVEGKSKTRRYAPSITAGAGKEESKRPYSPKIPIDRTKSETSNLAAHSSLKMLLGREPALETKNNLKEDGEAEVLRQLKIMFPEVGDEIICKAYVESDSDADRAAEALFQLTEETPETSDGTAALEDSSRFALIPCDGKPPSSGKPEVRPESLFQDNLVHAKSANPAPSPVFRHDLIPSLQHPSPFTDDESDSEHATNSLRPLVSPETATSSSRGTSPVSSAGTASVSPRSRKKGKKDGKQVTEVTSSSSSDEEAKNTRRDMVDFMVSMLGGSVPVAVVADVIENLKGDFQQSLKCLLSMSAGSEGGLIGEEFGAMTDGSEGAVSRSESLIRLSSDGEEEDPATTLLNIFGADKSETIQQVLKEKGGNVGDAATVLMAMFESEAGASSGDDFTGSQHAEDQHAIEESDSEDPTVKINVEQLMAHFPLADESAVRSLLHVNNNSFERTAKMLYDSGLMPRGLDVASLSDPHVAPQSTSERSHSGHHQSFQNGTRARPVTPPYGSGTRPPGGYYEDTGFPQPRAHLQPLFRAEEFPEIGTEVPASSEVQGARGPARDSNNSLFLTQRSATNKHWRACQYYFSEAARARANREFSRAEALKELGRKHKRLAEAANQVVSSKIFTEKNKTIRNSVKIDVHGQLVQEALGHVDDHLRSLSNLTTISYLSIITGRGLHSENGKAKILPAVQKYLRERGYTFYQENPGCILVDLKAERQVPNSLSSADDADSRPSSAESYEERPGRREGTGNGQASYRKLNLA